MTRTATRQAPTRRGRARPTSRPSPAEVARRAQVALGLREPLVRVTGHPRMRERAAEVLLQRRRREQVITTSLLVLMLLGLATWGVLRSPLLWVEQVDVVGLDAQATARVDAAVAIAAQQNILDVDLQEVQAQVAALDDVESVSVRRILPSTVQIRVQQRTPVLAAVHDGVVYLLDREGVVYSTAESVPVGLPVAPLTYPLTVGLDVGSSPAGAVARVAAQMPSGLSSWVASYHESAVDGEVDAILQVPDGDTRTELRVHLGRPDAIDVKAQVIASLVAEVLDSPIRPTGIDVRIPDRPVVLT